MTGLPYRPMTGLPFLQKWSGIFQTETEKNDYAAFCTTRLEILQGMSVDFFGQKIADLTYVYSILSRIKRKNWILTNTK